MSTVAIDILRAKRATAKQLAFLAKLLDERKWAGVPELETTNRAQVRGGSISATSAAIYIDMHLRAARKGRTR